MCPIFVDEQSVRESYEKRGSVISQVMRERARSGYWPGKLPFGYLYEDKKREQIILDPSISPRIREAFFLMAEGKYSLRAVADIMAEHGLYTKSGTALSPASLWHILRNPFYCGIIRYKGELLQGNQPALIDQATFEKVQRNLAKHRRNETR